MCIRDRIYPNQEKIKLSIQEIIDCSSENSGCLGGQPSAVFNYVKKNGISFNENYEYIEKKAVCKLKKDSDNSRRLQSMNYYPSYKQQSSSRVNLLNQSYLELMNDIHRISNTPMVELMNVTPDQVQKNNSIIENVNAEILSLNLPFKKTMEYDYIRKRFYFVLNYGYSKNYDQYQDMYGLPYIPGIILLNDIKGKNAPKDYHTPSSVPPPLPPAQKESSVPNFPLPDPVPVPEEIPEPEVKPKKKPSNDDDLVNFDTVEKKSPSITPNYPFYTKNDRYTDLKNFYFIKPNIIELLKALQYGPVIIAHYVPSVFKFYKRGIFDGQGCEDANVDMVNHAAIVVGYNLKAEIPYFRLRSSWGADWGEDGYYRMKVGDINKKNKGICLLAGTPFMVFPHIKNFA